MGIYEQIKDCANLIQKADNIELYRQILDIQKESLDLIEENRGLKNKVKELEEKLKEKENVVYLEDAYYLKKDNGEFDGPYCRVCWDKDKKLIRMSKGDYSIGEASCNICHFIARTILKE